MKKLNLLFVLLILSISISCNKDNTVKHISKINQIGALIPVENVIESNGVNITWVRNGEGIYQGNLSENLPLNSIVKLAQPSNPSMECRAHFTPEHIQVYTGENTVNGFVFKDGVLIDCVLEITAYN